MADPGPDGSKASLGGLGGELAAAVFRRRAWWGEGAVARGGGGEVTAEATAEAVAGEAAVAVGGRRGVKGAVMQHRGAGGGDEAMSCPRTWSSDGAARSSETRRLTPPCRSMASIEDRWSGLGQSSRSPRFQRPYVFRVSGVHSRHTHPCAVSSKHPSLSPAVSECRSVEQCRGSVGAVSGQCRGSVG